MKEEMKKRKGRKGTERSGESTTQNKYFWLRGFDGVHHRYCFWLLELL